MRVLPIILLFALLSSCISSQYKPVTKYDIRPSLDSEQVNFSVGSVSVDGPYFKKIAMRKGNVLIEEEYERWSETPAKLLKRYWSLASSSKATKHYDRAKILVFEIDLDNSKAVIVVDLMDGENTVRHTVTEIFVDFDAKSYVGAMEKAIEKLTAKMAGI